MFPVAIVVCTTAMMSGIAGTALYMPIFLLLFPALGAEYPLKTPMEAVISSLLTSSFGFASGFIAYHRRRLIDYEIAGKFLKYAIPAAIFGAIILPVVPDIFLRGIYAVLTLFLAYFILLSRLAKLLKREQLPLKRRKSSDGTMYEYSNYSVRWKLTGIGGFLTGLLSVGIW